MDDRQIDSLLVDFGYRVDCLARLVAALRQCRRNDLLSFDDVVTVAQTRIFSSWASILQALGEPTDREVAEALSDIERASAAQT